MVHALRSGYADPGESKLPNVWCDNAKWRARISTRVSINLNQKYVLKIMS